MADGFERECSATRRRSLSSASRLLWRNDPNRHMLLSLKRIAEFALGGSHVVGPPSGPVARSVPDWPGSGRLWDHRGGRALPESGGRSGFLAALVGSIRIA